MSCPQTGFDLLARADRLRAARTPFVLATVVRADAPTSARPGDRAIVHADGTVEGFAGGACAVSTLRAQSALLLQGEAGGSVLLRIVPDPDGQAGAVAPQDGTVVVDNPCLSGGRLELFLEAVVPSPLVLVSGDSPIARAVVAVGAAAGYETRRLAPGEPVAADAVAVVVASHGHDELPVLRAALAAGTPYVALVASPRRGAAVRAELALPAEQAGRLKTPAGLDLGAGTPGQVAVSILAELISRKPVAPAAAGSDPPRTAVDPVCGMDVMVAADTPQHHHAGQVWYFCATGCRDAFAADPDRYAVAASSGHPGS